MLNGTIDKRLEIGDVATWKSALESEGFVILGGVLSQEEVAFVHDKLWTQLESLNSGLRRSDSTTWTNQSWPGWKEVGFLQSNGICQGEAAWFCRSHPNVVRAFAEVWETTKLITSLDTIIAWRPWKLHTSRRPKVERLHVDQNPYFKPGRVCVQGMLVLKDVTMDTGGLQVVPRTNTDAIQEYLRNNYHQLKYSRADWCELHENDKLIGKGELLMAKAGDLILWDSRTLHAGYVGTGSDNEDELSRLALTVCMAPAKLASAKVLEKRVEAFRQGKCLSHWPTDYHEHSRSGTVGTGSYEPIELSPTQKRLLDGMYPSSGSWLSTISSLFFKG